MPAEKKSKTRGASAAGRPASRKKRAAPESSPAAYEHIFYAVLEAFDNQEINATTMSAIRNGNALRKQILDVYIRSVHTIEDYVQRVQRGAGGPPDKSIKLVRVALADAAPAKARLNSNVQKDAAIIEFVFRGGRKPETGTETFFEAFRPDEMFDFTQLNDESVGLSEVKDPVRKNKRWMYSAHVVALLDPTGRLKRFPYHVRK